MLKRYDNACSILRVLLSHLDYGFESDAIACHLLGGSSRDLRHVQGPTQAAELFRGLFGPIKSLLLEDQVGPIPLVPIEVPLESVSVIMKN